MNTPIVPSIVMKDDDSEGSWASLPERLRGRGDFLIKQGRVKDPELMFDAALEIVGLRASLAAAQHALRKATGGWQ